MFCFTDEYADNTSDIITPMFLKYMNLVKTLRYELLLNFQSDYPQKQIRKIVLIVHDVCVLETFHFVAKRTRFTFPVWFYCKNFHAKVTEINYDILHHTN